MHFSLTCPVSAAAAAALPSEPPALEPSAAAGVPDPGPASRLASPVPSSARRTLRNQTAASFVAAGGASSPVTARKGKGKKKAKADEVGPDNSDDLVKVGGTPFVPGEDDIFNRNRLVNNEAVIAGSVVALQRSNKTALDTLSVLLATVDDLKKAAKAAPSVPAPPSDPAFASLYGEHVETRHAVNRLSTTLGSFPPGLTVRDALLELKAAVANFDRPPPFARPTEDHIVSPATVGSLPASSATFPPPSLPPLPQLPVLPPVFSGYQPPPPRRDLHVGSAVKRKRGDAPVTDQDALYGPISRDARLMDVAAAAVNAVPGLNAIMIYTVRRSPRANFLSIRFHSKDFALKFVHLFQYAEGQGDRIAFFPEGSPNLPAQGVASGSRPSLR